MATSSTQSYHQPIIYEVQNLASLLLHIVRVHAPPTTIIVCGEQQAFLQQVLSTLSSAKPERPHHEHTMYDPACIISRTIHFLSASRTVTLAFCNSIPSLHAYLSNLSSSVCPTTDAETNPEPSGTAILALLNPVSLHRETAMYSAQGLGTTFAAAVEAACKANRRLLVAECPSARSEDPSPDDNTENGDVEMTSHENELPELGAAHDPWSEPIPILNARTRTIVTAGDRAWLGRTVSTRDVAKRWFIFEHLLSG